MDGNGAIRLKLIGDDGFLGEIRAFAARHPDQLRIESDAPEAVPERLGFELTAVAAVVAIVSGTLTTGKITYEIAQALRKSKADKAILQTPFATLELRRDRGVSEEDVRILLDAARRL